MKFPVKTKSNFSPLFIELSGASAIPWISYTATKNLKHEDYAATRNNSRDKIGGKSRTQSNMYIVIKTLGKTL